MTATSTTPGGINPNPRTFLDMVKNWQRLAAFLAAGSLGLDDNGSLTLKVTPPIVNAGGNVSLTLGANSGLVVTSNALTIHPDGTTLALATNILGIKAGGVGLTQLGALTTKGDLLGFSTVHVRVGVGADGTILTADSTQTAGLRWVAPSGGTVTSIGLTAPSILSVSGSPVTTSGSIALSLTTQNANLVFAGPTTGSAATPTFRSLVTADLPAGVGTVTSVSATVPSFLAIAGSPVTTSGTLALTLQTQSAALVFAGPTTGAAAAPTFRALAATDLPAGTGTVTSVSATVPSFLAVGGSPVTTSGTLAISLNTQSQNLIFAGPGSGSAAVPTFRALLPLDLSLTTTGDLLYDNAGALARLPVGGNGTVLTVASGLPSWQTAGGGSGTVTSVDTAVPSILTVSGNPITTSGTLAFALATQSPNTVLIGPSTGPSAAVPTFRNLVWDDFGGGSALTGAILYYNGGTSPPGQTAGNTTNGSVLTIAGGVPTWQTPFLQGTVFDFQGSFLANATSGTFQTLTSTTTSTLAAGEWLIIATIQAELTPAAATATAIVAQLLGSVTGALTNSGITVISCATSGIKLIAMGTIHLVVTLASAQTVSVQVARTFTTTPTTSTIDRATISATRLF